MVGYQEEQMTDVLVKNEPEKGGRGVDDEDEQDTAIRKDRGLWVSADRRFTK